MKSTDQQSQLLCPSCRYDVTQTLADGIEVCPECGGEIRESACIREPGPLTRREVGIVGLLYAGPLIAVFACVLLAFLLAWLDVTQPGETVFLIVLAVGLSTPFFGAWFQQKWSEGETYYFGWFSLAACVILAYMACGAVLLVFVGLISAI